MADVERLGFQGLGGDDSFTVGYTYRHYITEVCFRVGLATIRSPGCRPGWQRRSRLLPMVAMATTV